MHSHVPGTTCRRQHPRETLCVVGFSGPVVGVCLLRLAGTQVEAYAVHPGGIQTNLQRHLIGVVGLLANLLLALLTWLPFVARIKSIPQVNDDHFPQVAVAAAGWKQRCPCACPLRCISGMATEVDIHPQVLLTARVAWPSIPAMGAAAGPVAGQRLGNKLWQSLLLALRVQGVATTIYAATSPELDGRGGSYLADCAIAEPSKSCQDMEQVGPQMYVEVVTYRRLAVSPKRLFPAVGWTNDVSELTWWL